MSEKKPQFIGLSQYKVPYNFELAGRHFHFVMDDGHEYSMKFLDGEVVEYAEKGKPYIWDTYLALKGDETTFLVMIEPDSGKGKIHYNLVIDTEQRLITFVLMEEGYREDYPRLIRVTPFFGAIKVPGRPLPTKRHHLSKRMTGRHIVWHYNEGFAIEHIYHSPINIRAGIEDAGNFEGMRRAMEERLNSPDPEVRAKAEEEKAAYEERRNYYPIYEEESFHIYINEKLNLMCFLEENMNRLDPKRHAGGGGILLLQDIERVIDMGVCFSGGEYYMCTAYGVENEVQKELDTMESPYDWSQFEAMPSIYWEIPEED